MVPYASQLHHLLSRFSEILRMRFARYALLLSIGVPAALTAQGFAVNELGTCTMGRGGVAGASPCADGSAIWYNPAGLANLAGTHFSVGGTLIAPHGGFTDDFFGVKTDMLHQTFVVPNVYLTHHLGKGLGVGIGLYAPYGLGTKWPTRFQRSVRHLQHAGALHITSNRRWPIRSRLAESRVGRRVHPQHRGAASARRSVAAAGPGESSAFPRATPLRPSAFRRTPISPTPR